MIMDDRKLVAILDDVLPDLRTLGSEAWTDGTAEEVLLGALRRAAHVGQDDETAFQRHLETLHPKT